MPRTKYRIRRDAPLEERFWDYVEKGDGCWLWTGPRWFRGGYGRVSEGKKNYRAHRLAWTITNGEIPDGMTVCHRCDVPLCVRPDHLFLGTNADNNADRDKKNRNAKGEKITNSVKLTEKDVREMRRVWEEAGGNELLASSPKGRMNFTKLGAMFGVSRSQARHIINRVHWKHVP